MVSVAGKDYVQIGCTVMKLSEWYKRGLAVARAAKVEGSIVSECRAYLDFIVQMSLNKHPGACSVEEAWRAQAEQNLA